MGPLSMRMPVRMASMAGWGSMLCVIMIITCNAEQRAATGTDSFASAFDELDALTKKGSEVPHPLLDYDGGEPTASGSSFMDALGKLDDATKRKQHAATRKHEEAAPTMLPPPKQLFKQYEIKQGMEAAVALEEAKANAHGEKHPGSQKAQAHPTAKAPKTVKKAMSTTSSKKAEPHQVKAVKKKNTLMQTKVVQKNMAEMQAKAAPRKDAHKEDKVWKAVQAMKAAMHSTEKDDTKHKEQVLSTAKATAKVTATATTGKEEETDVTLTSTIELRSIWAFLGIISLLVLFTVAFEHGKETVEELTRGTPAEPIAKAIFGELTVLGFLALVTFLIGKFGLDHVSTMIYGTSEAEDKAKLGESLEQIHMVIFMCMVIFVLEALGMLWTCSAHSSEFEAQNSQLYKFSQRKKLIDDYEQMKADGEPGQLEKLLGYSDRAKKHNALEFDLPFMLIREV